MVFIFLNNMEFQYLDNWVSTLEKSNKYISIDPLPLLPVIDIFPFQICSSSIVIETKYWRILEIRRKISYCPSACLMTNLICLSCLLTCHFSNRNNWIKYHRHTEFGLEGVHCQMKKYVSLSSFHKILVIQIYLSLSNGSWKQNKNSSWLSAKWNLAPAG